jgi:hypothetical protein
MSMRTELFLVPLSTFGGELRVLVKKDPSIGVQVLPNIQLKGEHFQRSAQEHLLRELLTGAPREEVESWMTSPRYRDRIVEVYDRNLLFEDVPSVAIVRGIAIPEELAPHAKGTWLSVNSLFSQESLLSADCKLFSKECLSLVSQWIRSTTFPFELLPAVFSIQDLRMLVSLLASQDIDPGNFHRRLKKLDVLRPLVSGQRVHRWEFVWGKDDVLRQEGLIP